MIDEASFFLSHIWDFMTVAGYILEICGVAMMANRFMGVDILSLVIGMYTAIFKSKMAGVISDLATDDDENVYRTFRGLSLLLWGFSLQFAAFVFEKF